MAIRQSSSRQKFDANDRIPESLTHYLRREISNLPSSPKADYLKEEAFSKFVSSDTDPAVVRRQRAINKWLATEEHNGQTNVRLLTLSEEYNILPRVTWRAFRSTLQRFAEEIIGVMPSDSLLRGGFSGGATTSRSRTESHPAQKYLGSADVTEDALGLFSEIFSECDLWASFVDEDYVSIVPGNVLFTVPKNAEIDRCACKEPDLNMYLQRGLGNQIRAGLRRVGIDLNNQSNNRRLARQGSIDGSLATLDLSSASDSISTELVAAVLPDIWYSTLAACRSPVTVIDGEIHRNEMFSSMGNGFTFELESLLFYVISRAVSYHLGISGIVSIYGDDIIVPTEAAEPLIFVLEVLGFQINGKKSFFEGDFRESCGGHYKAGCDITPFYVKGPLETLTDLIHTCNQLRRWAVIEGLSILDPDAERIWLGLARHVPRQFWGGHDCSFKGQLVSLWVPNKPKRLLQRTRPKVIADEGMYALWLDGAEFRQSCTSSASSAVETLVSYRAVKSRFSFGRPDQCFLSEVTSE